MQKGTVPGDVLEMITDQGGKAIKETGKQLVSPLNILEGLDPINPAEVAEKSKMFKEKEKQEVAQVRSRLHQEIQAIKIGPQEDRRIQTGEEQAEKGKTNQALTMNNVNPNGPQPLSANMTPKKKAVPLVVQQKRKDKLQGAG